MNRYQREVVVDWFAEQVKNKLRLNEHKGGWRNDSVEELLKRLREESAELIEAINALEAGLASEDAVVAEAADVAAFAMMIADVVNEDKPDVGEQLSLEL